MKKIDSTVLKETIYIAIVSVILSLIMQIAFLISGFYKKQDPIFYLGISAIFGLIIGHLQWIGV